MHRNLKGVLLDLDNTLYCYATAHGVALDATARWWHKSHGSAVGDVQDAYRRARKLVNQRLHGQAASHSRLLYFQTMCLEFRLKPFQIALEAESLYWTTFIESMVVHPGCLEFLEFLKAEQIPVVIVSDLTAAIQLQKIVKLGLAELVAEIVTSEESGCEKPAAPIFTLALEKLTRVAGTTIREADVCMIGDNWEKDIVGATGLGIRSFWFKSADSDRIAEAEPPLNPEIVRTFEDFGELKGQFDATIRL